MQAHPVSVIVPVYNVGPYLEKCLDSIIAQTYTNLEIILVDDGSPDNCPAICDSYADTDNRIKVIHKKNGGLSSARNAGLEIATGEYIGYIDSDDHIAPDMYEKMIQAISANKHIGVVACRYAAMKGDKEVGTAPASLPPPCKKPSEMFSEAISPSCNVTVWNKLYRRSVIQDIRFYEGLNAEDVLYHYQVCLALEKYGMEMAFLPDKLYYYRTDNPTSICNDTNNPLFKDVLQIYRIMIGLTDDPARKKICYGLYYRFVTGLCLQFAVKKEYRGSGISSIWFEKLQKEIQNVPLKDLGGNGMCSFKMNCCNFLLKYCPALFKMVMPAAYQLNKWMKRISAKTV